MTFLERKAGATTEAHPLFCFPLLTQMEASFEELLIYAETAAFKSAANLRTAIDSSGLAASRSPLAMK